MDRVDTQHRKFTAFSDKWRRVRDTIAGQDAVHAAGEKYLPKLKDQEPEDYRAYVMRAGFFNATWRTINGLSGMMFRKPPQKELPAQVEQYADDIDMAGTSLETFVRNVAFEVLGPTRVGIMVDHPRVEATGPMTLVEAQRLGLRPMLKLYKAETIINWKHDRVANHYRLTMVVLQEEIEEPEGEFGAKPVMQWRVLDLDDGGFYRQRVYRKAKNGEFELIDEFWPLVNGLPLREIPFAIVGAEGIDCDVDDPALIDLVDVNLSHYRTNADYEHGCHFTGLPTAYISGYTNEDNAKLYIGSASAWVFPDPNAKADFLEFTGQGLGALEKNLDRKEQQMAILGARMIAEEKRVAETATTSAIHRTGENSVLAAMAMGISEAMEWALALLAQWAGGAGKVVYQINRDYNPAMLDAAQLTALLKAVQAGEMSSQSFFELLQRADIQDSELSYDEEQERIGKQGPPAPVNELAA